MIMLNLISKFKQRLPRLFAVLLFLLCAQNNAWAQEEVSELPSFYIGASGAMTLPQASSGNMRTIAGASLRSGLYCSDFIAVECEAASMENMAGFTLQGLWHWQGAELYNRLFGYSSFDPFFTLGARGWLGSDGGQVGPKIGTGTFWHLTEEWSLRADADVALCLDGGEWAAFTLSVGFQRFF
ncbi:MAG: hypothetical protein J6R80_01810 [Kiritimatiellae bacterium]|nr:hypothetical protein [Kiritimatiellia bacterium]